MPWWRLCVVVTILSLLNIMPCFAAGLRIRPRDGLEREGRGASIELDGIVDAEGDISLSSGGLLGGSGDSARKNVSIPVRLIVRLCENSTLNNGEREKFSVVVKDGRTGMSFQVRIHSPYRYRVVPTDQTFNVTVDSETSRGSSEWLTQVENYSVTPVVLVALERVGAKEVMPSNTISTMQGVVDEGGRVTLSWEDPGHDPERGETEYEVEVRRRPRFRPVALREAVVDVTAVPGSMQSVSLTHGQGKPFAAGDTLQVRIRLRRHGEEYRDTWTLRSSFSVVLEGDDPMAGFNLR